MLNCNTPQSQGKGAAPTQKTSAFVSVTERASAIDYAGIPYRQGVFTRFG